jgi:hypothetical protein
VDIVDLGVVLVTLGGDGHDPGIQVREMLLNRIREEQMRVLICLRSPATGPFQFSKESEG